MAGKWWLLWALIVPPDEPQTTIVWSSSVPSPSLQSVKEPSPLFHVPGVSFAPPSQLVRIFAVVGHFVVAVWVALAFEGSGAVRIVHAGHVRDHACAVGLKSECDHVVHQPLVTSIVETIAAGIEALFIAELGGIDLWLRFVQPRLLDLHLLLEISDPREVFVEFLAVDLAKACGEGAGLGSNGVEHAGAPRELDLALSDRVGSLRSEEFVEQHVRPVLGRKRRAIPAPGKRVVLCVAKPRSSSNPENERGVSRLMPDRVREFLITGDAQLAAAVVRVCASQERAIPAVAAGVCQLEPTDNGEVATMTFEWLKYGSEFVIGSGRRWREVPAIQPEPPHAEDGAARNLVGSYTACRIGPASADAHRLKPRQRQRDARSPQKGATSER